MFVAGGAEEANGLGEIGSAERAGRALAGQARGWPRRAPRRACATAPGMRQPGMRRAGPCAPPGMRLAGTSLAAGNPSCHTHHTGTQKVT